MEVRAPHAGDRAALDVLLAAVGTDGSEPITEYKRQRVLSSKSHERISGGDRLDCYVHAAWHGPVEGVAGHHAIEVASLVDAVQTADVVRSVIAVLEQRWVFWARRALDEEVAGLLGLVETRALSKMSVSLPAAEASIPSDVTVVGFRHGKDEDAWIAVNNAAFAGHPENGAVTANDLEDRFAMPWFDTAGLRMAWRDGVLVGSCWTKVHRDGVGEIYIIGVDPPVQGQGLGRALVLEGLRYLSDERGAVVGFLWADTTATRAFKTYESIGFRTTQTIRQFEKSV